MNLTLNEQPDRIFDHRQVFQSTQLMIIQSNYNLYCQLNVHWDA